MTQEQLKKGNDLIAKIEYLKKIKARIEEANSFAFSWANDRATPCIDLAGNYATTVHFIKASEIAEAGIVFETAKSLMLTKINNELIRLEKDMEEL